MLKTRVQLLSRPHHISQYLLAGSDLMALAVIAELQAAGRRVPEDVQVVGFDDIPEAAATGLTTGSWR